MKIMIDEKDLLKIIAENLHHDEGVQVLKIIKKQAATFSDEDLKMMFEGVECIAYFDNPKERVSKFRKLKKEMEEKLKGLRK